MASSHSIIIFMVTTLVVLATSVSATEYIVGDASGWTLDYDYSNWAKDKVFMVGDKLVFNYASGTHNVMKVNGTGFQQCDVTSSNGTLTSGRDVIPLLTPGRKWYICGVAKHCELRNMKLVITVLPQTMAPAPSPSASSALALPAFYGFGATLIGSILSLIV
uniref:blue copper protein 1b-like n=1 Tax=Erigeron canadensis TaxID=72917 RepID=UPI001CB8E6DE|nr:blue copper protein 1b-like [Erigeron canadensis]